jgi:hypothetical protein
MIGLEAGLQDQRAGAIAAGDMRRRVRTEAPASGRLGIQQRGKAGRAVEARQAEPVDGAVAGDQRGGAQIPDQRMLFDPRRGQDGAPRKSRANAA